MGLVVGQQSLVDDPEFNEAIRWMYDKGITNYAQASSYLPFETVNREQMAKMLAAFARAMQLTSVRNEASCVFSDVPETSAFYSAIQSVCSYGVMNGNQGKFQPQASVSKAEFIAMLIRLIEGRALDETQDPRWQAYYQKAIDLSLISAQDTVTFSAPIVRYEVAIFFYRMKTSLTMYHNLNDTRLPDEILRTMEKVASGEQNQGIAKVFVDVLALNNTAFKA